MQKSLAIFLGIMLSLLLSGCLKSEDKRVVIEEAVIGTINGRPFPLLEI